MTGAPALRTYQVRVTLGREELEALLSQPGGPVAWVVAQRCLSALRRLVDAAGTPRWLDVAARVDVPGRQPVLADLVGAWMATEGIVFAHPEQRDGLRRAVEALAHDVAVEVAARLGARDQNCTETSGDPKIGLDR